MENYWKPLVRFATACAVWLFVFLVWNSGESICEWDQRSAGTCAFFIGASWVIIILSYYWDDDDKDKG